MPHVMDSRLYAYVQAYIRSHRDGREPTVDEAAAWSSFQARFDPLIKRRVKAGLWRNDIAPEDRAQHVWAALIATLPNQDFTPTRSTLDSWIHFLTGRALAGLARASSLEPVGSYADLHGHDALASESGFGTALEQAETAHLVHSFLEECEAQGIDVALVRAHWFEEKPLAQIARERGKSAESVWIEHHRLLKRMRVLISRPAWRSLCDLIQDFRTQSPRGGGKPCPIANDFVRVVREPAYYITSTLRKCSVRWGAGAVLINHWREPGVALAAALSGHPFLWSAPVKTCMQAARAGAIRLFWTGWSVRKRPLSLF